MNITKLADFGIAKAAEQTRITQVGSVLGTAAYLSPEQAHGEEAGPPSDIYSLGVCAYQFLTGRLPHEYGSLTELALKQQQDPVQPITDLRPEVPPELDEAIRLCLEREPGDRYRSALEMAAGARGGPAGRGHRATRRMALSDTTRRGRWTHSCDGRRPRPLAPCRARPMRRPPRPPSPPTPRPRPLRLAATAARPRGPPAGATWPPSSRCCSWWPRSPRWDSLCWPPATAEAEGTRRTRTTVDQQIQDLRDFIQDNSP